MPEASRIGHLNSGPISGPSPAVEGSPNVSIGGVPVLRVGDHFADGTVVEAGAPHVFINGHAAARMGDPVSSGGTVAQGCPRVKIGNGGGPGYGFEAFRRSFGDKATEKDKLLLCIPHIAKAMAAEQQDANEAQGWLYLHDMMMRWLSGPVNRDAQRDKEPFPIDWNWVMGLKSYVPLSVTALPVTSPRMEYEAFVAPFPELPSDGGYMEPTSNIYNTMAKRSLGKILTRDCFMRDGEEYFDFISSPWSDWEAKYHTLRSVPLPFGINGQNAALGSFTLRALAKGRTEPIGGGRHRVHVTGVAVFVHDLFNFADDGWQWLAYWSCEEGDVSLVSGESYYEVHNEDFRSYQDRLRLGHDYLVLSQTHMIEDFEGIVYEYPL